MVCDINKLTKLLDIHIDSIIGYGDKRKMPCPLHGGSDANMFVDIEGEGWYCHSVCQRGGKLTDLIAEYRNITAQEASMLLRGTKVFISSGPIKASKPEIRIHKERIKAKHLPQGIIIEDTFRKINTKTLEKFGVYLCTNGRFNDRIIIPLYNEQNKYIGFQARRMYSHETIGKYVFSLDVESRLILYNYNNAKKYKELYIVEGVFGVMNFFQHNIKNVVGLVGGGVGAKRIHLLKDHKAIICVDNDLTGDKYRQKMQEANIEIKDIIIPPLGIDFDNMNLEWFNRLIMKVKST